MIAGGPVCWRSKKQTIVATSSCEAEYIASCSAAKEAVWLSRLVADLSGVYKPNSIKVFADNQGAIDSGKNQAITLRNKHIDISITMCEKSSSWEKSGLYTVQLKTVGSYGSKVGERVRPFW